MQTILATALCLTKHRNTYMGTHFAWRAAASVAKINFHLQFPHLAMYGLCKKIK